MSNTNISLNLGIGTTVIFDEPRMAASGRVRTYRVLKFMQEERRLSTAKQPLSKLKYQRSLGLESANCGHLTILVTQNS
jgi:hypothetical protein